ncbi:MAG: polysaccharide deacetylase family protein [Pararhodobacter sp.]|nr:polysaccharide deacetylase family protein [Pararhodobacter sp.]
MNKFDRRSVLSGLGVLCLGGTAAPLSIVASVRPAAAQTVVPVAMRQHGLVHLNRVETVQPLVALTFDDGPHPVHTPVLLDILAQYRARATFYVIGSLVRRYPEIVQRMVAEGHELGNHTWAHPTLSRLGNAQFMREIDRTQQVIYETVGHVPVTMRPPYGAITQRQSRMLAAERNLPTVIWSVDPQDWRRPGSSVVAQRMVAGARPGAIILAHDIHAPTVRAVPAALEGLQARGLRSVTLSGLLGWGAWGPQRRHVRPRVASNPHPRYSS